MVFSSLIFLCLFLPAVLLLYSVWNNVTYKNIILTAASLIFYAWGEPSFIILLLAASVLNYLFALGIDGAKSKGVSKLLISVTVIFDILMIGVFKYAAFFVGSLNSVLRLSLPVPSIGLPLGISFYTFQILTYVIDVYKKEIPVQKSYLKFLTFVSMFPQLIAGPIVRYAEVSKSLDKRRVNINSFADGCMLFVFGLGKKVLIANYAGSAKDMLFAASTAPTVLSSWLGIVLYSFQLYFDFSGYSDMAIGMGKMLGFEFPQNFNYPYISRSVTEFWRRWHMTLSRFFRDYVYIPLGGNRCSKKRWIMNTMIVWMLTGLWHGASWNFVLWGLYYGILLLIEKLLFKNLSKIPVISNIITLFLVVLGWSIFYFTDFSELKVFLEHLAGIGTVGFYDLMTVSVFQTNLWLILACVLFSTPIPKKVFDKIVSVKGLGMVVEGAVMIVIFIACIAALTGATSNPFLYFRF